MKQLLYSLFLISILFCSCSKKEEDVVAVDQTAKYEKFFNQTELFTTAAFIGGEPRTHGDGLPLKFYFKYDKSKPKKIVLEFHQFKYGNMPFAIDFRANLQIMGTEIKNGEKRTRLYCNNATTTLDPTKDGLGGASATGYFYPDTDEFEIFIAFNVMSVTTSTPRQKIDPTRMSRYEEEMTAYKKSTPK
ncbi:DUF4903 family protein [Halosquirtibacter laminarini]|uniref:DUF4903 family protein n=1 Tax=Halosquirtibacter laminarini TaxID=3374600 RepID=A0AC61NFY8_9BACT|nr:DUF4903 family protein [Prolixibacteraceae bacterium]